MYIRIVGYSSSDNNSIKKDDNDDKVYVKIKGQFISDYNYYKLEDLNKSIKLKQAQNDFKFSYPSNPLVVTNKDLATTFSYRYMVNFITGNDQSLVTFKSMCSFDWEWYRLFKSQILKNIDQELDLNQYSSHTITQQYLIIENDCCQFSKHTGFVNRYNIYKDLLKINHRNFSIVKIFGFLTLDSGDHRFYNYGLFSNIVKDGDPFKPNYMLICLYPLLTIVIITCMIQLVKNLRKSKMHSQDQKTHKAKTLQHREYEDDDEEICESDARLNLHPRYCFFS